MSEEPQETEEIKLEIGIRGRGIVVLKMTFDDDKPKFLHMSPIAAIDLAISIAQTARKAFEDVQGGPEQ